MLALKFKNLLLPGNRSLVTEVQTACATHFEAFHATVFEDSMMLGSDAVSLIDLFLTF